MLRYQTYLVTDSQVFIWNKWRRRMRLWGCSQVHIQHAKSNTRNSNKEAQSAPQLPSIYNTENWIKTEQILNLMCDCQNR